MGVVPSLARVYTSSENVAVTGERQQARIYAALVRSLGCDANVSAIDFFHLIDDRDLIHYQSGLLRVDGSPRPALAAVRDAIRRPCAIRFSWRHSTTVLGARAALHVGSRAAGTGGLELNVTASEDAEMTVALLRVAGPVTPVRAERALAGRGSGLTVVGSARTSIRGGVPGPVSFTGGVTAGRYAVVVRLSAAMNPQRASPLVSGVFPIA